MRLPQATGRVIRTALLSVFGAQLGAAAVLVAADNVRKHRAGPPHFPRSSVTSARAADDVVSIYSFGDDLYRDMLTAIRRAKHTIFFETFIWKKDPIGQEFKSALIDAANRGVAVYIVYDQFANLVVRPSFFTFPENIHVKRHPLVQSVAFWNLRNSGRDHRKILVVDSKVAFMGGYNIGSRYARTWRDTHARFQGPSVADFENAFVDYWNLRPVHLLSSQRSSMPELPDTSQRRWNGSVRLSRNTPRWAVFPIRNMYLEAIDKAQRNIWITSAYLIPDDDLRTALARAAQRGVDVRIIVPAQSNHVIADWLSRGYYTGLLRDGIRLFLFHNAMVHAKTATIDGRWSTIGTANIDRLSLAGNYEINAEITSPQVASALEKIFMTDLSNCTEMDLTRWERRSIVAKGTEALLAPWRPMF